METSNQTMNPPEEATPRTDAIQLEPKWQEGLPDDVHFHRKYKLLCKELEIEIAQLRRQVAEGDANTSVLITALEIATSHPIDRITNGHFSREEMGIMQSAIRESPDRSSLTSALAAERAATIKECAATCEGTFSPYESKTGCCDAALDKAAAAIRALGNTDGGSNV